MIDFTSFSNDQLISLLLLAAFILGWLLAQIIKLLIYLLRPKNPKNLFSLLSVLAASGGMPSGHSAATTALTFTIGFHYGFLSPLFVLAACFTSIVIYDAINVRWAVGEHGKLLAQLTLTHPTSSPQPSKTSLISSAQSHHLSKTSAADNPIPLAPPRLVLGHTLPEVVIGSILGSIIALSLFCLFPLS